MRFNIILILILLASNILLGQTQIIKGKVININGEPIENVYISDTLLKNYTITNERGEFSIEVSPKSELVISHVAYETLKILVHSLDGGTKGLLFIMKINTIEMQEIAVFGNKKQYLYTKKNNWVYDYEFVDNNKILILIKTYKDIELALLSSQGKILDKYTLPKKSYELFKDGLNNVSLLTKDSVFQFYNKNNQINLLEGYSLYNFHLLVEPCVLINNQYIYFKETKYNDQFLRYYYINKNSKEKNILLDIFDINNFETIKSLMQEQYKFAGVNYMGDNWIEESKKVRKFIQWEMYIEEIVQKPIYSPLFSTNDSIYAFDLINGSILVFNFENNIIRQTKIDFYDNKGKEKIEIDAETEKFYFIKMINGFVNIWEINTFSGTLEKHFFINKYLNPEKIKIHHKNVYFIYSNFNFNKNLFKIPLYKHISSN